MWLLHMDGHLVTEMKDDPSVLEISRRSNFHRSRCLCTFTTRLQFHYQPVFTLECNIKDPFACFETLIYNMAPKLYFLDSDCYFPVTRQFITWLWITTKTYLDNGDLFHLIISAVLTQHNESTIICYCIKCIILYVLLK